MRDDQRAGGLDVDIGECRQYVFGALTVAMNGRHLHPDTWVDDERLAVAVAANQWAEAHGYERRITTEDIERIEGNAVGHIDYASKLALYVAEFIIDPAAWMVP